MIKYLASGILFLLLLGGCRPAAPEQEGRTGTEATQTEVPVPLPAEVQLRFVEGSVLLVRSNGSSLVPEPGQKLMPGDTLSTDADSSLEISLGALSSVRLLPSTRLTVASFSLWGPVSGVQTDKKNTADLFLEEGAMLVKLEKIQKKDEFVVITPNSAASVRGTAFLVEYQDARLLDTLPVRSARTRIAVKEGEVAVLDKGPLLDGLIDGRHTNPVAGAALSVAFAFASSAQAGQELIIGGNEGKALEQENINRKIAEQAYGSLVYNAQESYARGFDLEAADDPADFIAAPGSETRNMLQKAVLLYKAAPLTVGSSRLLQLLDYVQEPDSSLPSLPASLPMESLRPSADTGNNKTARHSSDSSLADAMPPSDPYPDVGWTSTVSDTELIGSVTRVGPLILVQDKDGTVHALDGEGNIGWSTGKDVLALTALDTTVALTEPDAMIIADAADGKSLASWIFDSWAALPDYKPLPVPEGIALATPKGIAILRHQNAQIIREIEIPGGIAAPMVLADRDLVAISGDGNLVFVDVGAGIIRSELKLAMGKPVYAPRYKDNRIIVCNKDGRIAAVQIESMELLWDLAIGQGIKTEPELDEQTLYIWTTDNSLRRFKILDASEQGTPIQGVVSPPLLSQGKLYWGSSDSFVVVADAETGSILKKIAVPDVPSVRPLLIDGTLYIGTRGGRVVRLDSTSL